MLIMVSKKRWRDLTRTQQRLIIALATVELALTATALVDLARRPADQVRGPKPLWVLGCFVQPVGPLATLCSVGGQTCSSRPRHVGHRPGH
jgi:hypothetical protein